MSPPFGQAIVNRPFRKTQRIPFPQAYQVSQFRDLARPNPYTCKTSQTCSVPGGNILSNVKLHAKDYPMCAGPRQIDKPVRPTYAIYYVYLIIRNKFDSSIFPRRICACFGLFFLFARSPSHKKKGLEAIKTFSLLFTGRNLAITRIAVDDIMRGLEIYPVGETVSWRVHERGWNAGCDDTGRSGCEGHG